MSKVDLKSELTLFDVTNLVVGAIIGADIYVASAFGAKNLGPFSLVVWVFGGIIAIVIALCFAQCAALLPKVGGPYAYAKEAWGPFAGFVVGWSLWLAEWVSLAVFPLAFVQYLGVFLTLSFPIQTIVKGLFVAFLVTTNIVGVKAAGKTNDVLTVVKLAPLVLFAIIGILFVVLHPTGAAGHFTPFLQGNLGSFGITIVLVFWAYAGFEISTIPAGEIKDPGKTIPKAIVLGITIVTIFYLITNILLFGIMPSYKLASSSAPLADATKAALVSLPILAAICLYIVGGGALVSVAGSDESGMIGTSRLGYALAADGLFPKVFAKVHARFKTPYLGIIIEGAAAFVAASVASTIGGLGMLIAVSVFFMAASYLATSASVFFLRRKVSQPSFRLRGGVIIPVLGAAFSLYLITQCTLTPIVLGVLLLLVGVPIYVKYSPKKEIAELKQALLSREAVLKRVHEEEQRFLAHALQHVKHFYRRVAGKKQT
ncbi:MAG: APC family permease [Candidatus Bathyarchaeia archaeon]|jgi:amino acid transporter